MIPHYRYVGPQHQHKSTGCTGDDESAPKTRDSTHRRAYLLTYQEPLPMLRGAPACRVFPDHLITYLYQPRCLDIPFPYGRSLAMPAPAGRAWLRAGQGPSTNLPAGCGCVQDKIIRLAKPLSAGDGIVRENGLAIQKVVSIRPYSTRLQAGMRMASPPRGAPRPQAQPWGYPWRSTAGATPTQVSLTLYDIYNMYLVYG